jgi:hypothetical protein
MPFQSEKQRKYLHANHPEIAKRWEKEYATGGISNLFKNRTGFHRGSLRHQKTHDYRAYEKSGDWLRQSPPENWLTTLLGQEKMGYNEQRDAFESYMKERFMYGEKKQPLTNLGKSKLDKKINAWLKELFTKKKRNEHATGGISNHFKLKEGGRTGFRRGTSGAPGGGDPGMTSDSSGKGQTHSGGDGGYQNVHQTGAVTQTPGRTTTPDKGDGNIKKGPQEGWTQDDVKKAIKEGERKKELRDLALQGEKTEKWEQAQKWTKPSTGSKIIGGLITLATMGVLGPGAAKAAKYYGYYNKAKKVKTALDTGKFKIANKEFNISNLTNKLTSSDQKLMESLPKGHPERIALEAQMKVKTPPKHDGEGGATTSIKIEDIETVNDANAEQVQLKKYREMELASYRAMIQQQEDRSKQMAYWKQMMAPYMSAQGGRVPGGYNTGGLSNLFRLKNR